MKFTIITASYNYAQYIGETIQSVLSQTYKDWELLIVEDGSTDNSVEVISSYVQKDPRIKLLQHENNVNKGLKETLLLGLKTAQTDWVVFLESDDTITPDYLEKKAAVISQYPDVGLVFNDVCLFGDEEKIKDYTKHFKMMKEILSPKTYPCNLLKYFAKKNIIPTFSCVAIKKNLFDNIDLESPLPALLDYYLWVQIAQQNDFYYIDEKLTNWRIHHKSYISDKSRNDNKKVFLFNLKKKEFVYKKKNIFLYALLALGECLVYFRRNFLKIHPKDRQICFCGNWYKY